MSAAKVAMMVIELDDVFLLHLETRCSTACQMAAAREAVWPWIDMM